MLINFIKLEDAPQDTANRFALTNQLGLQRNPVSNQQSIPLVHSVQHDQQQRLFQNWDPQTGSQQIFMKEPVNYPSLINQEIARLLEKYLTGNHEKQPISNVNSRSTLHHDQALFSPKNIQSREDSANNFQAANRVDIKSKLQNPTKRGKVDDVVLFNTDLALMKQPPLFKTNSPHQFNLANQPLAKLNPLLKFQDNCISRSAGIVSSCEDRLVKRLHQDAREGRTALDVERRVCCALFWHKDCITSRMVETCPDSSPAAADRLMGSRKIDLTISCQNFNRDGCNSSRRIFFSKCALISSVLVAILSFACNIRNSITVP